MDGTRLMVIGGSGFFGKSILDAFHRGLLAPWNVGHIIVVARSASVLWTQHPDLLGDHVTLIDADVGTAPELPSADYVIHAASSTDARRYAEFPQEERANILKSINNYCRIARATHRASKIVYTSSGAVYGQQPATLERVDESYEPGEVGDLVAYKRDYAEAKRLAEQRIAALGSAGLAVSVARCFAFMGYYLPRDQHFAIGNFIEDGLRGRPVKVNAQKRVYRSYMHADDLVRWLMTIADNASVDCPIFNVGSDEAYTIGEVASAVARRFGVAADVPAITETDMDRYIPSIAKANRELSLKLSFDLNDGIDDIANRLRRAH